MEFLEPTVFSVKTEVTSAYLSELLVFIYQGYVLPFHQNFANARRWTVEGREVLAFTFLNPQGLWHVDIEVTMGNPIWMKMTPSSRDVPQAVLNRLKEDLIIMIQLFEEKIRRSTLYFAWVPYKGVVPEKTFDTRRKILRQIFMGNMLVFFVLFLAFSYLVFLVAKEYTPIALVLVQFVIVLFSDKIIGRMGDWPITAESPYVHILQYSFPPEEFETFKQRYTRDDLLRVKKEIYDKTLALGRPIDDQVAQEVFSKHGTIIRPENLLIRTINVYQIVKNATGPYNMPVPKIRIANVIIPNAATSGPDPHLGVVLITTGLLVQLDEEEIFAVVGHEISHLKGRDQLALSTMATAEYLIRVYFLLQFVLFFGFFIFFYFFFSVGVIYFIYKFFEARADLESAIKFGHPKTLASALRKIGYRRLQFERMSSTRVGRWLVMDPHPPVSFRIERLENLKDPRKIKHPFVQSMKDCVNGLLSELKQI